MPTDCTSVLMEHWLRGPGGGVLASRVCAVACDGTLLSPRRGSIWPPSGELVAPQWDDGEAVTGRCGIHAVQHAPAARPRDPFQAVVHIEASGRIVASRTALRCERAKIAAITCASREQARLVRARCPGVPVRVLRPDGVRNGATVLLAADGVIDCEHRRDGLRHGLRVVAHPDGSREREHWRAGHLHGPREIFLGDGLRDRQRWRVDVPHGPIEFFHPDGSRVE